MQLRAKDLLLIPNLLSLLRIAAVFIPVYLISTKNPDYRAFAAILVVIGIGTDILDGYLARKLGQVSDLGKILDPFADKFCTAILALSLYFYSDFPLWAVVLILSRDVAVLIVSGLFIKKTSMILTSNLIGKLAALSWGIVILIYIIDWSPFKTPALIVAATLVALSVISYTRNFVAHLMQASEQRTL